MNEEIPDIKNLCSFLLIFSPEELVVFSSILGIIIASQLTIEEQNVLGAFLTSLADNIFLISAQLSLINSAIDEQKAYNDFLNKKENNDEIENIKNQIAEIKKLIENNNKNQFIK